MAKPYVYVVIQVCCIQIARPELRRDRIAWAWWKAAEVKKLIRQGEHLKRRDSRLIQLVSVWAIEGKAGHDLAVFVASIAGAAGFSKETFQDWSILPTWLLQGF